MFLKQCYCMTIAWLVQYETYCMTIAWLVQYETYCMTIAWLVQYETYCMTIAWLVQYETYCMTIAWLVQYETYCMTIAWLVQYETYCMTIAWLVQYETYCTSHIEHFYYTFMMLLHPFTILKEQFTQNKNCHHLLTFMLFQTITGTSQLEYHEKGQYFWSLISESETHILYRFITQSEILQAFISWNFDDYFKTLWYFKQKCPASEKYVHFHALNTWLGLLCMNYCINAAWHGVNQPVALLRCNGSPGCFDSSLQVICFVGSGVSHLPLDNTP